ncbi:Helix-turn-helix domain [uncultured Eubacterium sp.]|nr:Helix-turn-helix domain [uncultured Eubacterium sp.]
MANYDDLIARAQCGDKLALEKLLLLYQPMIDRHSRIHGHIDEDLRQFIYLRILVNLKYFRG